MTAIENEKRDFVGLFYLASCVWPYALDTCVRPHVSFFLQNAIYLFRINLFKCTNVVHKNTLTRVDVSSFNGFLKI